MAVTTFSLSAIQIIKVIHVHTSAASDLLRLQLSSFCRNKSTSLCLNGQPENLPKMYFKLIQLWISNGFDFHDGEGGCSRGIEIGGG